jgi:predicted ATP-dependent serine protease
MLQQAWPNLNSDFQKTIKRLKGLSRVVEEEAEAAKMDLQAEHNPEIISIMQSQKVVDSNKSEAIPCFHVPLALNERFIKRNEIVESIGTILDPTDTAGSLKSLAIYGTGGVGKTQIALQYVHKARRKFDAVLWIMADSNIKMSQDFLTIAQRLGLVPDDGNAHDPVSAMSKTKSWLADTSKDP